jgi:hypothetical protein
MKNSALILAVAAVFAAGCSQMSEMMTAPGRITLNTAAKCPRSFPGIGLGNRYRGLRLHGYRKSP